MVIDEITYETPLGDVLKSEDVTAAMKDIDVGSALMKNASDRASTVAAYVNTGVIGDAIMTFGQQTCVQYCSGLCQLYSDCIDEFPVFVGKITDLAENRERAELLALRKKVEDRVETLKTKIGNLDQESDDYEESFNPLDHEKRTLVDKIEDIRARINKLNAIIPIGGYIPTVTNGLFDTGNDDNNRVYGANIPLDINSILSDEAKDKWILQDGAVGFDGKKLLDIQNFITDERGNRKSNVYNLYYTYKDPSSKSDIYLICGPEDTFATISHPIVYITEVDGHKVCYDKSGQPISYNTAMDILEISRCSNNDFKGNYTYYYNEDGTEDNVAITTTASPYSPTLVESLTHENDTFSDSVYEWKESKPDEYGQKWVASSNEISEECAEIVKGDGHDLAVFKKDRGNMGTINVIVNGDLYHDNRVYSIKQLDGTYLYYDEKCNPISSADVDESLKNALK